MFRYVVLGLLRGGTALHGYALMKAHRERAGIQVGTGSFYRELQRLVADGLVRTASRPPGADPRRAPYAITPEGAAAFDAWLAEPLGAGVACHEDALSARAAFLPETDTETARTIIAGWHRELWQRGKALEAAREAALRAGPASSAGRHGALPVLLARRLRHVAADLEFLGELRQALGGWAGPGALRPASPRAIRTRPEIAKIPGPR